MIGYVKWMKIWIFVELIGFWVIIVGKCLSINIFIYVVVFLVLFLEKKLVIFVVFVEDWEMGG